MTPFSPKSNNSAWHYRRYRIKRGWVKSLMKWKGLNEKSVNVSKVDRNLVKNSHTYVRCDLCYAYGSKGLNYYYNSFFCFYFFYSPCKPRLWRIKWIPKIWNPTCFPSLADIVQDCKQLIRLGKHSVFKSWSNCVSRLNFNWLFPISG